ncbi:MAG: FmdB family zinc ribbon protein [Mycolicibacterium sp.]|uniref:FmdB family zinc ribbon protein n=1 Tax=Mycolicibacterium sp. TaxID=2320850 RepID=UPI003D10E424
MPTYSYACTECDNKFDVVQSFTDDSMTDCPSCEGRLRKLFGKVGVVFKGSGFYRTDSREAAKASNGATSGSAGKGAESSSAGSSDTSSGTKSSSEKSSTSSSGTSAPAAAASS